MTCIIKEKLYTKHINMERDGQKGICFEGGKNIKENRKP